MNKLKLLLLLLIPISIKAQCTNQELTRYKTLAGNADYYYEYDGRFNITLYNISNELKVKNMNDNNIYTISSAIGETKINGIEPGTNLKLALYPKSGECESYRVQTIYVNLPYYNKYYQDEICVNNKNVLCSKWANTNGYTYEQFVEKVKDDKQEIVVEEEPTIDDTRMTFVEFIGQYYLYILGGLIVLVIIGKLIARRKDRFDF